MSKVFIKQIAAAANNEDGFEFQYLDNYGRVWYQVGHYEEGAVAVKDGVKRVREWVIEWKQLELPDEPDKDKETL